MSHSRLVQTATRGPIRQKLSRNYVLDAPSQPVRQMHSSLNPYSGSVTGRVARYSLVQDLQVFRRFEDGRDDRPLRAVIGRALAIG